MADSRPLGQSVASRYLVVEVHDGGARIMVWHGRGEKDAIRQCHVLNERNEHPTIHYTVEED